MIDQIAKQATEGRIKEGWLYAHSLLEKDPLNVQALTLASYCMRRMGNAVHAYHFALAGVRQSPTEDALWLNLGAAAQELWLSDEAENAYNQALRYCKTEEHRAIVWLNLAALYIDIGKFSKGEEYAKKVLGYSKDRRSALANVGFCQLARRDWANGWKGYHNSIGSDWRPRIQYLNEPEWDGSKGKVVALYEDQGIGDAISFASMLPDAIAASKKVILDCDARLVNLFKRSFPKARIYGTRSAQGETGEMWAKEDRDIQASLPLGQIGEFFRNADKDFPGTPYLVPCPTRTSMWKEKFKGKRTIGIAWTGGIPRTNARHRQITLTDLLPILRTDARFVVLQYKDASKEIEAFKAANPLIDIVQYPWATLTKDYDDTAALVAALDHVVCMQTAVGHLSAALGIPTTVFIPVATTWRYGEKGDSIPWYKSMRIIRQAEQGKWSQEIERAAADLGKLSQGAGGAPRDGELRSNGRAARANGQRDHRETGNHPCP